MYKLVYKCLNENCNSEFVTDGKDGCRCPACGCSPVAPIRKASDSDISQIPNYEELKNPSIITKKSWEEFRKSGLLWWINMILHTFGWAIIVEVEEDGSISNAYPARVKFRGFSENDNTEGYAKVSQFIKKNAAILEAESKE